MFNTAGKIPRRSSTSAVRPDELNIFDLVSIKEAVALATATVAAEHGYDTHSIVWDGWRRILFIGPGASDDRGLDGALLVAQNDLDNEFHIDAEHQMTLSDFVAAKFNICRVREVCIAMVRKDAASHTGHI